MSGRRKQAGDGSSGPSDESLVAKFYDGDEDAFNEIYRRYRHKLYHQGFRFGLKHHDAEGRVQDTLVKFYESRTKKLLGVAGWYDPQQAKFSTWLYRIHYNNCIDLIRRRGFGPVSFEQVATAEDDGRPSPLELIPSRDLPPDEILIQAEAVRAKREAVREAVAALPVEIRTAIELYYLVAEDDEPLTQQQIAAIIGCSTPTVFRLLEKGRRLIRESLIVKEAAEAGAEAIEETSPRRIDNA
jgi:RNA polymerase sigma-70 factor (ECF subfamily)